MSEKIRPLNMLQAKPFVALLIIAFCLLAKTNLVQAQSTAFTYQGLLDTVGSPARGNYDLRFGLYPTNSGGAPVANLITNAAVPVSNGVFTVTVDFGEAFNGASYWLEIGVRTNASTNGFTTLSPRQEVTPSPYSLYALAAGSVNGVLAPNNLPANVALLNSNANFTGTITASNFTGNGAGLIGLTATNLAGVVPFTNGGRGISSILNVRNYGAKGDGINDDSVAIRNCIQSGATNGYAVVYIPAGTYLLNTTNGTTDVDAFTLNCIFNATNNTLIYGDGIDRTVLRAGNNVVSQSPVFHLATGVTNFNLQGMTVDCNVAGRGLGSETYGYDGVIWFHSATNIHITDMKGINTGGEAFDTGYSSFVTVERCIAIGAQGSGFTFSGPNGIIRDCQVYGCGYGEESFDPTRHWGAGLTIAYGAANMLVENCQFITNCMNVQVFAGPVVKISDCYFTPSTYNTNYDLYLNPVTGPINSVYVTGCFFNDASASLGSAAYNITAFQFCKNFCSNGRLLIDSTTSAQVLDNQFNSQSSSVSELVLTNGTVAEVALNYFTENQETPIILYSPNNFVHNNVFRSCYGIIEMESSSNTFSGNTSSDSRAYFDVYLSGSTNWVLNNALGSAIRFTSGGATGNQVINNTGNAALVWDTAATGNTFAFNNFPPSAIQSGNTYVANLQGQPGSGTMNFDTLNANTANAGKISATNGMASLATNTAIISATGWTNNFGVNATAVVVSSSATYTIYDGTGHPWFTNNTYTGTLVFSVQPNGKITATSGLAGHVHAN